MNELVRDPIPPGRDLYCSRTLNMRSLAVIGYDMDYTLVHYDVAAWEERIYAHVKRRLVDRGWPVDDLTFEPDRVIRGLVLDTRRGNILKINRFARVKRAMHGTRPLSYREQRTIYGSRKIDLGSPDHVFLNTFFSISEACLYLQLVDRLDAGRLPAAMGYGDLYREVARSVDAAHVEGRVKGEITRDPDRYVVLDPMTAATLLDQRRAGRELALITNSGWEYTRRIMAYAFDRFLPAGQTWRDLFELIVVEAGKPTFFTERRRAFEIVDESGLLRPVVGRLRKGGVYLGGDAAAVEDCFGTTGETFLYVGDHMFGDVVVSKRVVSWRTALIVRELEEEVAALAAFRPTERQLVRLMEKKVELERSYCLLRVEEEEGDGGVAGRLGELRRRLQELDQRIAPLAQRAALLHNPFWGPVMRAGADKSRLAAQIERYADVYTSRVANFYYRTPFAYLRAFSGSMPHDEAVRGHLMASREEERDLS